MNYVGFDMLRGANGLRLAKPFAALQDGHAPLGSDALSELVIAVRVEPK